MYTPGIKEVVLEKCSIRSRFQVFEVIDNLVKTVHLKYRELDLLHDYTIQTTFQL